MLALDPDQLLTTTRTVRKRLDYDRPVPRAVIAECLEIAFQTPNASNRNTWEWLVVDDPALVKAAAAIYNAAIDDFAAGPHGEESKRQATALLAEDRTGTYAADAKRMTESVDHLRQNMARAPALLFPMFAGRPERMDIFRQTGSWGSVLPAVWNFMLALRARGLGSAWTTVHMLREKQMAELLGIPYDAYTQVGLFPIAYTLGADFKKAKRKPVTEVTSWNRFGAR